MVSYYSEPQSMGRANSARRRSLPYGSGYLMTTFFSDAS